MKKHLQYLIVIATLGLTGCASFGDSLATFNQKFDSFNQEYEHQIFLQQPRQSWGIVQSVRIVSTRPSIHGEPARQMQELYVRMGGRSNDFRVVLVPLDTAAYRPGAIIHLN